MIRPRTVVGGVVSALGILFISFVPVLGLPAIKHITIGAVVGAIVQNQREAVAAAISGSIVTLGMVFLTITGAHTVLSDFAADWFVTTFILSIAGVAFLPITAYVVGSRIE